MKLQLHVDKRSYTKKPQGIEVGAINNRITKTVDSLTVAEIVSKAGKGHTIVPSVMSGTRSQLNFVSTRLIMLDFDFKDIDLLYMSYESAKAKAFTQKYASFMYTSFSHTEELNRYRIGFVIDDEITDNDTFKKVYTYLSNQYGNLNDPSCNDSSRLFFGGKSAELISATNMVKLSSIDLDSIVVATNKTTKRTRNNTSAPTVPHKVYDVPNWELIRDGDDFELMDRLEEFAFNATTKNQAEEYIKTIDMRVILSLYGTNFCDILKEEKNPSCSIFKLAGDDVYLYKRFNDGKVFNVIQVVAELKGMHYMDALDYLIQILNIEIVLPTSIRKLHYNCNRVLSALKSAELKETYPNVYKRFNTWRAEISLILSLFKDLAHEYEDGTIRSLLYMSHEKIHARTGISVNRIAKITNFLVLTRWIEKLPDNKVPAELLADLLASQTHANHARRVNVFELLEIGNDFMSLLELTCERLNSLGFTFQGFSKEWVERALGKEEADRVFSHKSDTSRKLSAKNSTFERQVIKAIDTLIEKKGYAIESDVLKRVFTYYKKQGKTKTYVENTFKRVRGGVIEQRGLQLVRANKEIKSKYGIKLPATSSPSIFIKAS